MSEQDSGINDETQDRFQGLVPRSATGLLPVGVLALGLVLGGWFIGDGFRRAKEADRAVTVRGLAEREVTADLATWTLAYSATAPDMASAQASVDRDSQSIRAFFGELGFPAEALQ
ncbi:MAG: SIMPL domain-containing protein, partial [Pseudomonadota bacterium]